MEEQKACALRNRERQRETAKKKDKIKQKTFFDYDCKKLQKNGKVHSLTKPELEHYLKHYKLSCNGRKDDWVQKISGHLLLNGVDQAGVVTSIAIQTAKYGKNVTDDYHDDDSSEDSDEEDACSSEDEVLAAGPWSEEEEEFVIIPETVTAQSGRVAGSASTVALH